MKRIILFLYLCIPLLSFGNHGSRNLNDNSNQQSYIRHIETSQLTYSTYRDADNFNFFDRAETDLDEENCSREKNQNQEPSNYFLEKKLRNKKWYFNYTGEFLPIVNCVDFESLNTNRIYSNSIYKIHRSFRI